jgi:orotidine-5'-phosphate decarboxylase
MTSSSSFSERIDAVCKDKQTNVVLAMDPSFNTNDLFDYVIHIITKLGKYLCAIKMNFHVILPLSLNQLKRITDVAHNEKLQVIADIKLNDIPDTNKISIQYLNSMGFDSIIVNPFMGKNNLKMTVDYAHSLNCGVISLVYMSHSDAKDSFGASVIDVSENGLTFPRLIYNIFYQNSKDCNVDGVVIGGNRLDILKEFSYKGDIPIYSPGLVTQGGDIKSALENGSNFLIIGRAILNSSDPLLELKDIHSKIKSCYFK